MPGQNLATYLNDHLAGSVAALELLDHLGAAHPNSALTDFLATLRADIEADQRILQGLMDRLGVTASPVRRAAAWVAEKAARLKLGLDGGAGSDLRLLESLEAVAVGIEGKRSLWAALAAASQAVPDLRGPDYSLLERRAEEQRQRIEPARLNAARAALADAGSQASRT
jgi:hypothetical protein